MSRFDFPPEEFADRRDRVRRAMGRAALDWLVLVHPVSIHWLTGSDAKSYQDFQALIVSAGDERLRMFTRESERAEFEADALVDELVTWGGPEPDDAAQGFLAYAERLGLVRGRIGLEVPAFYLRPALLDRLRAGLGEHLVAGSTLVQDMKTVKSARELAYVRRAAEIADAAVATMLAHATAGRRECEIAGEMYRTMLAAGAGIPATPLNLVSGPRAAFSHGAPTERRLAPGDFGHAEFNVPYRRHGVSIGRHFAVGEPGLRARSLHAVACAATEAAIAEIRAGVPATRPHEAAKRVIAAAGLDRYRVHVSGYGLAPAFPPSTGEPVQLFGGSRVLLQAGMVLSVCPPIFIPEEGLGARIVETVIVTERGCEVLSRTPRALALVG